MGLRFDNIPESAYDAVINKVFGHLNLQNKGNHYECVCPFCGDMSRPNKRKVWIWKDTWKTVCYRGCFDQNLLKFLKENSKDDYDSLLLYAIDDNDEPKKPSERERPLVQPKNPTRPFMPGEIGPITDPDDPWAKAAIEYCKSRLIRPEVYEMWYACRAGEQFYHRNPDGTIKFYPGTNRPVGNEYRNRMIIPFYKFGGVWGQFDARDLNPNSDFRYMNYAGVKREAFNVDFVDFTKRFYILEGTIDSTFIRNSIAIGGIDHLSEVLVDNPKIRKYKDNAVIIWDNDTAGRQATIDNLSREFKWFDWKGIVSKDINKAILEGEIPRDSSGYADMSFIESRVRDKELADIVMTMRFGNIRKEMFKAKQEARRKAIANNGFAKAKDRPISFF